MADNTQADRPNLYIVGFMGTGKSALGRRLAEHWHCAFIDSDTVIEHRVGKTIPQIFAEQGEAAFRRLEREFVETGHPAHGCVVACGGGMVTQPGISDMLKERGVVVVLFASPQTILARTRGNTNRPLLNVPNPEERIRELMAQREAAYLAAGPCIMTDGRSVHDLIAHLERVYRREAARFRNQARESSQRTSASLK